MAYTTINKSTDYFNTVTWTGTSSSPVNVTGYGFQPDMIWNKYRAGAGDHQLYDAVRTATKMIIPNSTAAESTNANGVTAFISDGFTAGSDINVNGGNSVAWGWRAGNSSGSSNTDGTITSTVSANTTAGFSIGTFTSAISSSSYETVGHSLNKTPKVIITKNLNTAGQRWGVQAPGILSDNNILELNTTSAASDMTANGSLTTVNSNVFSINYSDGVGNAGNYIFYAFAEIPGFSKFGLYQGNSNADGAFVYTGFKPAWVMIKQATGGNANEVWSIRDSKRDTFNAITKSLVANANSAEGTTSTHYVDFVSNGFKIRTATENSLNTGYGYFYMAFAEAPLVGSNNVPCTAR